PVWIVVEGQVYTGLSYSAWATSFTVIFRPRTSYFRLLSLAIELMKQAARVLKMRKAPISTWKPFCSGENESLVSVLPKYRHKRKNKKKTKRLSEHKTLLPTICDLSPQQPMSEIHLHVAFPSPPNIDSLSPPVESCIDPSTTGIMNEEEYAVVFRREAKKMELLMMKMEFPCQK
uniref:Uncharacterized protein n=1 Tax=Amphimedon queenslandica TaxID=400682 RepID=A0A1X7UZI9_AMPQE